VELTIPFSNLMNNPPGSNISLIAPTGTIQIADTGYYQLTLGVMVSSTSPTSSTTNFQLIVNGVATPTPYSLAPATTLGAPGIMDVVSFILQVTTNPTTITLRNTSGIGVNLNNVTATAAGRAAAYITIQKLQ
jgi:hypothetical protein